MRRKTDESFVIVETLICSLQISYVIKYCENEWPSQSCIGHDLLPYYQVRNDLAYKRGLLLKSDRIVIPLVLQKDVLNSIHDGHQQGRIIH